MSDAPTDVAVGIFGKLPSRGDFVRIGLPGDFVGAWDDWAQRMLVRTQEMLNETWEEAWTSAPAWRFAMPPGACGASISIGVMLPSVDRVGRYFPLAITAVLPEAAHARLRATEFCEFVESAGRDALDDALSPDELMVRVDAALEACLATDQEHQEFGWWTEGAPGFAPVFWDVAGLPDAALCVRLLVEAEAGS